MVCVVSALRMSFFRLQNSLNVERWVSWDRSCKQQALQKIVIFSKLVNMPETSSSSTATASFSATSLSCTASRIFWSQRSGWKLSSSRRGLEDSQRPFDCGVAVWAWFQVLLQRFIVLISLRIDLYALYFLTWHENCGSLCKETSVVEAVLDHAGRIICRGRKRPAHGWNLVSFVNAANIYTFVAIQSGLKMVAA